MKIDIITIFPNFFNEFLTTSKIKHAIEDGRVEINIHDLRDYTPLKGGKIDDTPYGGGAGMLMIFQPFYNILNKLRTKDSYTVLLSPQGRVYNQQIATQWSREIKHLILICGHYEGIDERVHHFIDEEISIGDYVLTGGEIPAMIIADSITRLLPGVINEASYIEDTHQQGLLKYPQYTKPMEYEGYRVPEVLLSGHHENIRKWRLYMSLKKTYIKRPDLIEKKVLNQEEQKILDQIKKELETK
ncbi:tRNA (guanosine(37)-N1)-methyltransferase TrmD [Acholeplasma equifetale]|jgi:tRNA (guanine37-N1)-methyltransferase|uniref:tRNA (guanosine(37)-N1)-methyltransferase TrmD n=1 Tax=Acholeplasma equifetale TaxID=264634 RepID=UPI000479CD35|nr:tRNA (guanosine(37)-N1)-methyltransferase TrmD [Acholeplasma equifetale]HHY97066.1 tRNA (guanosine(37)-N1)-methyltransferase TrmD [Acholeplasma sp.]